MFYLLVKPKFKLEMANQENAYDVVLKNSMGQALLFLKDDQVLNFSHQALGKFIGNDFFNSMDQKLGYIKGNQAFNNQDQVLGETAGNNFLSNQQVLGTITGGSVADKPKLILGYFFFF